MASSHRLALDAPPGELVPITAELAASALAYSRSSPRGRVILPFHERASDPLHRMFNAVQPGSYVRPHRHLDPPKAEAWVLLRGAVAFFTFEPDGSARDCLHIAAGSDVFGVDLAPGVYHSFIALEPDTLIYEVKPGPYAPSNDKTFPDWAPEEHSPQAAAYMAGLLEEYRRRTAAP
jgi:cupin fold WbuC family metalloprotein